VIRLARRPLHALAALAVVLCLVAPGDSEPAGDEAGARANILRVCADPDNLPFSSRATSGERGLYVELAELVAARLGMTTEYTWWYTFFGKRAVRNTLLSDRCDAFFGLPHDADFMGPNLALTRPFLDVGYAIVAPGRLTFAHVEDLKGRRVAVVFRTTPQMVLASRDGFAAVTFKEDEQALDALARGEVDAAFVWGPTGGYYNLKRLGGSHRVVPIAGEGLQWKAAVGVRKGDDGLRDRIERALAALEPEIRQLADRYGFPRGPAIDLAAPSDATGQRAGGGGRTPAGSGAAGALAATAPPPAITGAASRDDEIAAGRSLFNQHCAHCHAPNAMSPEPSRDLRRLRRRYGETRSQVFYTTVTQGRSDKGMPPWAEALDPDHIRLVWSFLESVQLEP
jgi:ABC-type amino acid transport substrate-binding protein/cytochrome c5